MMPMTLDHSTPSELDSALICSVPLQRRALPWLEPKGMAAAPGLPTGSWGGAGA